MTQAVDNGMEVSLDKINNMVTGKKNNKADVVIRGVSLKHVNEFTYSGSLQREDSSSTKEVIARIAKATFALTRLKHIWRDCNISVSTKLSFLQSLVLSVFLYAVESWTLNAKIEKRIAAFATNCYWRMLSIH